MSPHHGGDDATRSPHHSHQDISPPPFSSHRDGRLREKLGPEIDEHSPEDTAFEILEHPSLDEDVPSLIVGHGRHQQSHPSFPTLWQIALHLLKLVAICLIIRTFVVNFHRCCCTGRRRADRAARREDRQRRRALRRAAKKQAWKKWFSDLVKTRKNEYDEKWAMLAEGAEVANEDQVESEIRELRNVVGVVGDMVAAEEGRGRLSIGSLSSLPDYRSEISEELPSYTPNDGSEASSFVADGMRYTPGSTEYMPSTGNPEAGSVRNVLGDTKD